MGSNGTLTIAEASRLTGKCQNTIHRYIKKGVLQSNTVSYNGKQIMTVEKSELERVFDISCNTGYDTLLQGVSQGHTDYDSVIQSNTRVIQDTITKESLKEAIQEFFETKQSELIKPLEQQSLYRLGRIEQENVFLKAKVETLLQEIEQNKALPWQIEERDKEIKSLEAKLKEEKEVLEIKLLNEKEEALKELETIQQKEKEELLKKLDQQTKELEEYKPLPAQLEDTARKLQEKEEQMKNIEAKLQKEKDDIELRLLHEKEIMNEQETRLKAEFEQALKQAEEEKKQIAEVWKKELEDSKRPWWKFW